MGKFFFNDVKKPVVEESLNLVLLTIAKAKDKTALENLLRGLMTPKEIEEFAERIRIVQMLKKGISQHDIAGKLGVGVATVSRGAREIKEGNFKTVE